MSFELENDEALRLALERALRQRPEERPSPRELREALRLAIGEAAPVLRTAAPAAVLGKVAPFPHTRARSRSRRPGPALLEIPSAWAPAQAGPALSALAAPQLTPQTAPKSPRPIPCLPRRTPRRPRRSRARSLRRWTTRS